MGGPRLRAILCVIYVVGVLLALGGAPMAAAAL